MAHVLIVEDHDLIAQGLAIALRNESLTVDIAPNRMADEVLALAAKARPDIVLLDLHLGDGVGTGLPLIAPLTALGAKVILLSGVTDRVELGACVEAGVYGLASKAESFLSVLDKVLSAERGEVILRDGDRYDLLDDLRRHRAAQRDRFAPFEALTPREGDVLRLLMDGLAAEVIATETFVSVATVRSHIRGILTKLDVTSQLAAVGLARRAGWPADLPSTTTEAAQDPHLSLSGSGPA